MEPVQILQRSLCKSCRGACANLAMEPVQILQRSLCKSCSGACANLAEQPEQILQRSLCKSCIGACANLAVEPVQILRWSLCKRFYNFSGAIEDYDASYLQRASKLHTTFVRVHGVQRVTRASLRCTWFD